MNSTVWFLLGLVRKQDIKFVLMILENQAENNIHLSLFKWSCTYVMVETDK